MLQKNDIRFQNQWSGLRRNIIKMKMNYSLFTSSKDSDRTSTMFHMHPENDGR